MKRSSPGSVAELDGLLVETFHAYRQGLYRHPQPHSSMPPRDFETITFLGTVGWFPLQSRLKLRNLNIACSRGLSAARKGFFDESFRHYEHAREHLDQLEEDAHLAWLLGVSSYRAGVAYLDFRRGFVQHACEHLECAMDADLELEQAGLSVMQIHRIQQGHNLARMDFQLGRREVSVRLASVLLAYMEFQTNVLPYHREWRPKWLRALPRRLLQDMIQQIIGETAGYIVTGDSPMEDWSILIEASLCRDPEAAIFPQVQHALKAQCDRLGNDPEGYLRNLERFFRLGIRHCPLLWYALMLEFVSFCQDVDTKRSRQIKDIILRDSAKWKEFPSFLRSYLDKARSD